jgi:hypothetical protein
MKARVLTRVEKGRRDKGLGVNLCNEPRSGVGIKARVERSATRVMNREAVTE